MPEDLAGPDLTEDVAEAEYRQYLVGRALRLMQAQFQPATWWRLLGLTVEGRSAVEVAVRLGMGLDAVYAAKYRVLRGLRRRWPACWIDRRLGEGRRKKSAWLKAPGFRWHLLGRKASATCQISCQRGTDFRRH